MELEADQSDRPRKRLTRRKLLKRLGLATAGAVTIPPAGGVAFYAATRYGAGDPQTGHLALTGATVLAGDDLSPRPDTTVLIRGGVITEVGDRAAVTVPAGADSIDLSGHTLMPGLIDLHVHLGAPGIPAGERRGLLSMPKTIIDWVRLFPGRRRALLEHGVTAMRSLGDEPALILDVRRQVAEGELEGPRVFAAGPIFTTAGGHPVVTFGSDPESDFVRLPTSPDDARRAVSELATGDDPVDLIKVVQERGRPDRTLEPFPRDVLSAIVDAAHDHGLPVVAHWGTADDLEDAVATGIDQLEHFEPRGVLDGWPAPTLDALLERDVPISPTFVVADVVIPADVIAQLQARFSEFYEAGGRVTVGSDAGMTGVPFGGGVHRELELLVGAGLTPSDALRAATSNAARSLGTDRIGVIEPGRAADLLVVDGDPLADIRATQNVAMVFRDGRVVVDKRAEE